MVVAVGGVWLVVRGGTGGDPGTRVSDDALLILGGLVWAAYDLVAQRDTSVLQAVGGAVVLAGVAAGPYRPESGRP